MISKHECVTEGTRERDRSNVNLVDVKSTDTGLKLEAVGCEERCTAVRQHDSKSTEETAVVHGANTDVRRVQL